MRESSQPSVPTIKQMARSLGISVSAVSKALNNHPSIGLYTKERVKKLAQELNYVPNQAAIHFKNKQTRTLGVIVPQLTDHYYTKLLSGMEMYALQQEYHLIIGQSYDRLQREKELVTFMQRNRVDGLMISLSQETSSFEHLQALAQWNIPLVYVTRVPGFRCNAVSSNVSQGAEDAVTYLLEKGHRRIAHLKGPELLTTSQERHKGYLQAHRNKGQSIDPALIQECDLTPEHARSIVQHWMELPEPPTAVIAFKDLLALEILRFLKKNYPVRLATMDIIGFGNYKVLEYLDHPPTASIEEQPFQVGSTATKLLLDIIQQPEKAQEQIKISLPCHLVEY